MNGAESVKIERFDSKPHEIFMDFFRNSIHFSVR